MSASQNILQSNLPQKSSQFIIFKTEDDIISVDVRFESETAWLTQAHLAELFQTSRPNITMHIKNILASGEDDEQFVWSIMKSPYVEYHYSLLKDKDLDEEFRRHLWNRFDEHRQKSKTYTYLFPKIIKIRLFCRLILIIIWSLFYN